MLTQYEVQQFDLTLELKTEKKKSPLFKSINRSVAAYLTASQKEAVTPAQSFWPR